MKCRTAVYYTLCREMDKNPGNYKRWQRELADRLLAHGFQEYFSVPYDKEQVVRGAHGKPFLKGAERLCFNVSNTAGLVVCALSKQEVGIDAERIRPLRLSVLQRCCGEGEQAYILGSHPARSGEEGQEAAPAGSTETVCHVQNSQERFFQLWTLKESYIKMTGEGMLFPMKEVQFSIFQSGTEESGGRKTEISCNQTGFFAQKRLEEHWISLCTREKSEVVWRRL